MMTKKPEKFTNLTAADTAKVLEYILASEGLDFRQYKQTFIARRLERRLQFNQLDSVDAYLEKLARDHREYRLLLKDLVIQVSEFFRDPQVFNYLDEFIIPQIIAQTRRNKSKTIKIWCPGCANGEEVYSLAILFLEQLEKCQDKIELVIFGTDICENALKMARATFYPPVQLKNVSPYLLQKYFTPVANGYKVNPEVKERIKLGQHDLVLDPPINHLDLLACRNVCIYLERELQQDLYAKFVFALEPGGYLLLGKSESLTEEARPLFTNIEPRLKIFQKNSR